jgi:UDP-N-acetyl-D-glucosamine dehydrogenase
MPLTLEKIKNKTVTIGIIGLGYVGFPLALVFAEADLKVIGFDIDEAKIEAIHQGKSYIHHLNHGRLQNAKNKQFKATKDFSLIRSCDAIIICVPTPLDHHLSPDISFIVKTSETIAPYLQPHTLVSLESTTWPGTTEEIVQPILEKKGKLTVGKDLYLCFSPEREDPGNQSYNTKTIPKLVGAINPASLALAVALYSLAIDQVIPLKNMRVAETAKLFENIFRCVNIALVNELKTICDPMEIDVWEVIEAASSKPFGFMPFWPGPGLGGHCIPIDPFYLSWKAREFGIHTRFIELAGEINRSMPLYVIRKIQDCLNSFTKPLKGSKILILGITYKPDIDDMRESPSLELIKLLEQKEAQVDYHDPHIIEIGKNREYAHLVGKKSMPLNENYDCFVLATAHTQFKREEILSFNVPVIDTRNFFPRQKNVFPA